MLHLPLLQPHRIGAAPHHSCPQHSSSMVPSRPLSSSSSNRSSDGGALEINGIIVGNKNEFKEVSNILPLAVPFIARVAFLTRACSTRSGVRLAWTRATSTWWGEASLSSRCLLLRPLVRVRVRVPLPRHSSLYFPLRNPDGANSAPRRACPTKFEITT